MYLIEYSSARRSRTTRCGRTTCAPGGCCATPVVDPDEPDEAMKRNAGHAHRRTRTAAGRTRCTTTAGTRSCTRSTPPAGPPYASTWTSERPGARRSSCTATGSTWWEGPLARWRASTPRTHTVIPSRPRPRAPRTRARDPRTRARAGCRWPCPTALLLLVAAGVHRRRGLKNRAAMSRSRRHAGGRCRPRGDRRVRPVERRRPVLSCRGRPGGALRLGAACARSPLGCTEGFGLGVLCLHVAGKTSTHPRRGSVFDAVELSGWPRRMRR